MKNDSLTLKAVGDLFLGEHPVTLGHGVRSIVKRHGPHFLFENVQNLLTGADIVFGNLEVIISGRSSADRGIGSEIFWGEPASAGALKAAGFSCLSLANNHAVQHGREALERTCRLLDENGIARTGYDRNDPYAPGPALFEVRGLSAAIIAYCDTQQYRLGEPMLPRIDLDRIRDDVRRLRRTRDIVIVSLHWGDEFIDYPSPRQVRIARAIIDAGARLILGHHSHTVQGFERYRGGLIAYSLGSFVKDLWQKPLRETVLLTCELTSEGVKGFSLTPLFINDRYQPSGYNGSAGKKFLDRVEMLSRAVEQQGEEESESAHLRYTRDVRALLRKDRVQTAAHYLTHAFRYDPGLLRENIAMMIRRRVQGRNI